MADPGATFQYPPRQPAGQLVLGLQAESFLTNVARQTAIKMASYQQEWQVEKMKTKLLEYLHKAAKSVADGGRTWEKLIEDFAFRFVEAFWAALGDRDWLDKVDVNDLAACVQTSCIAYFPNSELSAVVNKPEYSKCCAEETERAFDTCRYSSWGWQVFKDALSNKMAQKKVGAACDASREKVMKSKPDSAEAFVKSWVKLTIDQLAEGGNLHNHMTEVQAIKLFNKLIQKGGGIPMSLLRANGGKPPKSCNEISDLVEEAYQANPPPKKTYPSAPASGGKGDGKDFGSWDSGGKGFAGGKDSWGGGKDSWGGGKDSWSNDSWGGWDMGAMMNMMNMMWGGKGGFGDAGCGGFDSCAGGKGGCGGFDGGFQGKGGNPPMMMGGKDGCGGFDGGFQGKGGNPPMMMGGKGGCGGFDGGFQGKGGYAPY